MHDSQWLDHHEKRKNYLWLVILIAAVCIAAGIFIRNNSDVLGVSQRQNKETNASVPTAVTAPLPAQSTGLTAAKVEPKRDEPVIAPVPGANESVPLERVVCRLMDKSQPSIRLSLLLSFPPNKALKQEILVKRDNLKVMVKKTLAAKSMDDMVVDSLRKDLKIDLNSVLENGAITDIEFKEFRIEKVE
jgi:flagellar basal body-associated protein FliL